MRSLIGIMLVTVAASFGLAGCGEETENTSQTSDSAPASEAASSGSPAGPLDSITAHLEAEGMTVSTTEPGDAVAAITAGASADRQEIEIAAYPSEADAKVIEQEVDEVFAGDEISGEGRVARVGTVVVYVADEQRLTPQEKNDFKAVINALEGVE